jgi:hypothetical protein
MKIAGKKVREMSRREFCYRMALNAAVILLMLSILLVVIVKIVRR